MRGVEDEDLGCAYPLGEAGGMLPIPCGAVRRPGSSYCPRHHLLCHIPVSSMAECRSFDETEALARVVAAGWVARPASRPSRCCAASTGSAGFFHIRIVHVLFTKG